MNWDELALRPTFLLSLHPVVGMLEEDFVSHSQNVAHRLLCLNGAHDMLDRNLQTSCFGKHGDKGAGVYLNLDARLQQIKCIPFNFSILSFIYWYISIALRFS